MHTPSENSSCWHLVPDSKSANFPSRVSVHSPFRIGRREGCELCLSCKNVSGLHAELHDTNGDLFIQDLNSTNGTQVNGKKIRLKTRLRHGDQVQIGQVSFSIASQTAAIEVVGEGCDSSVFQETTEDRFARLLVDGVVPFFQPIQRIDGDQNEVIGYEVLGRSRLFGLKTPDQMFAVATDLAKEAELSRILRLRGLEAAEAALPIDSKLFLNTHPSELDCDEIRQSLQIVHATFPQREIMLELPERVLSSPEDYIGLFESARELNVKLAVYDFGAGQIRLAELSRFKPDVVKFDCALTQQFDRADDDRKQLVSAMVKMITQLGITPMAEYVETAEEHETLREIGFQLGQGFHYGHPTSIETFCGTVEIKSPKRNSSQGYLTVDRSSSRRPPEIVREAKKIDEALKENGDGLFEASEEAIESFECLPNDADHLMQFDSACFTLQLMCGDSEASAKKFVAEQEEYGDYSIYRQFSDEHERFVVVFDQYEEPAAAEADMQLFQGNEQSCVVRKMSDVHDEIRAASLVEANEG